MTHPAREFPGGSPTGRQATKKKGLEIALQALDPITIFGAAGRIRTHDPLVRSQVLYPTELRAL